MCFKNIDDLWLAGDFFKILSSMSEERNDFASSYQQTIQCQSDWGKHKPHPPSVQFDKNWGQSKTLSSRFMCDVWNRSQNRWSKIFWDVVKFRLKKFLISSKTKTLSSNKIIWWDWSLEGLQVRRDQYFSEAQNNWRHSFRA